MYISNRLAGTATGDSLANLAARAASRATEAPAEAESNANLSGGSYDPSAHVSLSVDALLILSGAKAEPSRVPALTDDERNNIPSTSLAEREDAAFGKYLAAGDTKAYYRAYIEYYDALRPEDQASPRYAGTREGAVSALRSLAYSEKAIDGDEDATAVLDAILESGRTVRQTQPVTQPASLAPLAYEIDNVARYNGRVSRANNMYITGF